MALKVNVEHMVISANAVTVHGEDLATAHAQSDGRIAAAQAGWQGSSASALSTRLDAWLRTSDSLLGRIRAHAQGMHDAAQVFASLEQDSAAVIRQIAATGAAVAQRTG